MPSPPLLFDPVTTGTRLTPRSRINAIKNPAAILVLKHEPTRQERTLRLELQRGNCARIELTSRLAHGTPIHWKIENVAWKTGKPDGSKRLRARFFENHRAGYRGGNIVHVYGCREGRIRITASAQNTSDIYEAIVVAPRIVPVRIQLLRDAADPALGTRVTVAQAVDHLQIANRYLRQIGVILIADADPATKDEARPLMLHGRTLPGFFEMPVAGQYLREVPNDAAPASIRFNERPGVLQIIYLESMRSGASGRSINYPGNRHGNQISLWYRAIGDAPCRRHTMQLTPAKLQPGEEKVWGLVVTNVNEGRDPAAALQKYANTIAHEVGHIFDLAHRDAELDDPKNDGLSVPSGRNLMHAASQPPEAEDLDLIQAVAVLGSRMFDPSQV